MKRTFAAMLVFLATSNIFAAGPPFGNIKLLEGYKIKKGWAVDAVTWTIHKEGGLTIDFEAGMNEGFWADPKKQADYLWYREQTVNGHKVMLALIKPGLKTVWEPGHPRSPEFGNILLVTFPLGGQADHTANFNAEILNEQELADALLMILTFDAASLTAGRQILSGNKICDPPGSSGEK
jgi:hypothetical protein